MSQDWGFTQIWIFSHFILKFWNYNDIPVDYLDGKQNFNYQKIILDRTGSPGVI